MVRLKNMKKELNELLNAKDGFLNINEMFRLHHWTLDLEDDFLNRKGEFLEIEMTNTYGKTRSGSIRINSRDTQGIMTEVTEAMEKMMDEFKEKLMKLWNGGCLMSGENLK